MSEKRSEPAQPLQKETFSSKWGLILAALGMAIGTGNIWRFPRILSDNGGGSFLVPWAVFLLTWSIPLLMVEFAVGRGARRGPIGAFAIIFGRKTAFMGAFVGLCTCAILFYYSVVAGWCMRYFVQAVTKGFAGIDAQQSTELFFDVASGGSAVFYHGLAVILAGFIVVRGVVSGIERACRWLIPALLIFVVVAAVRSLTLGAASESLNFIFTIDLERLKSANLWIQGLTQSAWSTGAGWGLLLCYSIYAKSNQPAGPSCAMTGFGNNLTSMLAALAVIPAVFALMPLFSDVSPTQTLTQSGPASTGVTFVWIPILFENIPLGRFWSSLFFLSLSVAALSSLIAMIELASRILRDLGVSRTKAVVAVAITSFLCGLPSALSLDFFLNQDWVWSLGLILSGGFFAFGVLKFGVRRFRETYLPGTGRWFDLVFGVLIPLEFLVLLSWWVRESYNWVEGDSVGERLKAWLDPLDTSSIGTCLAQFAFVLIVLLFFNRKLAEKAIGEEKKATEELS